MNGLSFSNHDVAQLRHQEDMRRAAQHRLVREAHERRPAIGLIWKLFSRLALSEKTNPEMVGERTPRTAS